MGIVLIFFFHPFLVYTFLCSICQGMRNEDENFFIHEQEMDRFRRKISEIDRFHTLISVVREQTTRRQSSSTFP
jgi:hypothetical protein